MRKITTIKIFVLTFVLAIAAFSSLNAQGNLDNIVPGQYIVVFKDGVSNPSEVAQEMVAKHSLVHGVTYSHALKGFSARIPANRLKNIESDPRVSYIEQDQIISIVAQPPGKSGKPTPTPTSTPIPSPQVLPSGINRIDADLSLTANIDNVDDPMDVDIAIIDTGISRSHPDLRVVDGVTYISFGKPPNKNGDDDHGHGSHCAGIAAAIDNNQGVVGVAPGAKLWAVKVLNKNGSGYLSDIIKGIDYVTAHASDIEVANMSLGGQGYSQSERDAIIASVNAGVFYAVAAGNNTQDVYGNIDYTFGTSDDFTPAAYPEVATVSALCDTDGKSGGLGTGTSYGADDYFASFSNYSTNVVTGNPVDSLGAAIDLIAPGVKIYSTYKGTGYATMSGTSMASPHLAGAAALYISAYGITTKDADGVAEVRQVLIDMGIPKFDPDGYKGDYDDNPEPLLNVADF